MPNANETEFLFTRGLPSSPDAEKFILGSVLLNSDRFAELNASLTREDFAIESHCRIWDAMANLHAKGFTIGRVTLANELIDSGHLESVGGIGYLADLDDGVPALSDLDSYVRILQQKALARNLLRACYSAITKVYTNGDRPEEIAAWCESTLHSLSSQSSSGSSTIRSAGEVINEIGIQQFLSPNQAEPTAVPMPWRSLARLIPRMRPSQLIVAAARPGKGKSAWAAQLAYEAARHGTGVAFFSLEMSSVELLRRMAVGAASVDGHKVTLGRLSEVDRHELQRATAELAEAPIWLDDSGGRTVPAIERSLRKLRAQTSIGLVVVDYLQLLSVTGRRENRNAEITEISRGLKLIAVEHHLPVLALAQINRAGATEVPDLHHLRDGGSIEADADVVLLLHAKDADSNQPMLPTRFIVRKHRGGPVGSCELLFHRAFTRFVEPDREPL